MPLYTMDLIPEGTLSKMPKKHTGFEPATSRPWSDALPSELMLSPTKPHGLGVVEYRQRLTVSKDKQVFNLQGGSWPYPCVSRLVY